MSIARRLTRSHAGCSRGRKFGEAQASKTTALQMTPMVSLESGENPMRVLDLDLDFFLCGKAHFMDRPGSASIPTSTHHGRLI